jgi:[acyl-carrier-protein] S-malonyltransferase
MGLDLLKDPSIKALWDASKDQTGIDFEAAVTDEDILSKTRTVQPLILLVQESLRRLLNLTPQAVAGQSLGEYNALVAAGVLRFEDALELVIKRGEAMASALTEKTVMKAALGEMTHLDQLLAIPGLYLSNLNSPSQVVIGGTEDAFNQVSHLPEGIKRLIPLKTEGAFHTPYMKKSVDLFKTALANFNLNAPKVDVYQNVTGLKSVVVTQESLLDHLVQPVQFYPMIQSMINAGIDTFIEISPSPLLSKTILQINPSVTVKAVTSLDTLHAIHP